MMMTIRMKKIPVILVVCMLLAVVGAWDNDWDQPLNRQCPTGEVVSSIESYHNNDHEDRRWSIRCKRARSLSNCYWSDYVNRFPDIFEVLFSINMQINFNCRTNYVIAGMSSYHINFFQDRRWKYYCCRSSHLTLSDCMVTDYVNDWDEQFYWKLPAATYYLTGVISDRDEYSNDRRWKFRYCRDIDSHSEWENDWDQPLTRQCPNGKAVSSIESYHHNQHEDRRWSIRCKSQVAIPSDCYWTDYVNDFDQPINFNCHTNYVIAGMSSYHVNRFEDRRWKYYCCRSSDLTLSDCMETDYVNNWDEHFYWELPAARYYVTGVISVHNNDMEDRRWKFRYCRRMDSASTGEWDNDWDQPLNHQCPTGKAVSSIESYQHKDHKDRRWSILCKRAWSFTDCYWTDYINDFDQPINFNCRTNYVIAGMSSYHSNVDEDRRWKYYCCGSSDLTLSDCMETSYVNNWDEQFYWELPAARYYVTGVISVHNNDKEDRRWKFQYCRRMDSPSTVRQDLGSSVSLSARLERLGGGDGGLRHAVAAERIRFGHTLNDEEREHVTKRRVTVQQCLNKHNIRCTLDKVPNIALIGSGGGERAMVGLLGSVLQLWKEDLLDSMMYLSGVSGSTWCMASLYKEPNWSSKMQSVVTETARRLGHDSVSWRDSFWKWNNYYSNYDNFDRTHGWAAWVVATYVKEIDENLLSDQRGRNDMDPYPIYTVVDHEIRDRDKTGGLKDKWFEMTPHEAGYSLTGAFVDQRYFGSKFDNRKMIKRQPEMDMLYVQGICGSALADLLSSSSSPSAWSTIKEGTQRWFWNTQTCSCLACKALQILVDMNLQASEDEDYSDRVKDMNKLLEGKVDKMGKQFFLNPNNLMILDKTIQMDNLKSYTLDVCESFPDWYKDCGIDVEKWRFMISAIKATYTWGNTYNFLHNMKAEEVDRDILGSQTRSFIDAGLLLNSPYFSVLRKERNIDLIISLDFSEGDPMTTIEDAHKMSKAMGISFPHVNFPENDRTKPKDFYVFPGHNNSPTVIHMPLFNIVNCPDDLEEMRKEYKTKQLSLSPAQIKELMERAAANVINTKSKLLEEILKAVNKRRS